MKLKNRTALVTGASRGIGRAIARALGAEGAKVVVNYVSNRQAAENTLEAIKEHGSEGMAVQADIADQEAVDRMFTAVKQTYGRVDILVNNAGVWRGGRLERTSRADWDYVLDSNLKGTMACCRAALQDMIPRNEGRIINITSVIGLVGFPGDTVYGASKAGLIGLTKSLAREAAKYNIRVNAVAPGIIETDMNTALDDKVREGLKKRIPLGCLGQPGDVAEVCCFLASGASYVTGQVWVVDGGFTMMS